MGGYLTSIVAGTDSRFRFAAPVYGCGFLGENSAWVPRLEQLGPELSAKWLQAWDPSAHLRRATMPILWVNGTNDFAYPMDSWQKSYRLPNGPRTLCLRIRMPHGHGPAGENPEEIHVFANQHLKEAQPLAKVTEQGATNTDCWLTYESPVPLLKAELCFTRDQGRWQDRKWEASPAVIDAAQQRVSAPIPADARAVYLNLFDERNCVVSSEHIER